jgi:hypothetical protein
MTGLDLSVGENLSSSFEPCLTIIKRTILVDEKRWEYVDGVYIRDNPLSK